MLKYKQIYIVTIGFLLFAFVGKSESLILEGTYQGRDIYIQNPTSESGVGYTVKKTLVNGQVSSDEINSSAFIIDLSIFNFNLGESVLIEIIHQDGNVPQILNPESLQPLSTFEVSDMAIDSKGNLSWKTNNENGSLPFKIEQFRWNKWVVLGEVQGIGINDTNTYSFKVDLNTGKNKIRVSQKDHTKVPRRSKMVTVFKDSYAPVRFIYNEPKSTLIFNESTRFEIFNEYGVLMKKGYGKRIDINELVKGQYFVNFDNNYDIIQVN